MGVPLNHPLGGLGFSITHHFGDPNSWKLSSGYDILGRTSGTPCSFAPRVPSMLREKDWKEYWYRIVSSATDMAPIFQPQQYLMTETKSKDSSSFSQKRLAIWGRKTHKNTIFDIQVERTLKNAGMVALPTPKHTKTLQDLHWNVPGNRIF